MVERKKKQLNYDKLLTVWVAGETSRRLRDYAKRNGTTVSKLLRLQIEKLLEKE